MYVKVGKRAIDFIIGLIALPFILLVTVVIAPLIYFNDKGPIFYNAERLGKNGIPFKMYKFRSMMVNAPDIRNEDGSTYNGDADPRVTKIGRFMRKTSIDELPQFLNVLLGNMSLIGPRPDAFECQCKDPDTYQGLSFEDRFGMLVDKEWDDRFERSTLI